MSPRTRVILTPFSRQHHQQTSMAVVNCVVSIVCRANEILGIHKILGCLSNIIGRNRIHVVNADLAKYAVAVNAEVAAKVTPNYIVSDRLPLRRVVKALIQISLEAKGICANLSVQLQVFEAFSKGRQLDELTVSSNKWCIHLRCCAYLADAYSL